MRAHLCVEVLFGNWQDSDLDGFLKAWWPGMADQLVRQVKAEYPGTSFPSQHNTYRRARSASLFAVPHLMARR